MRAITFLSQKGGSGKTTLAVHLAVAAEAAGEHACIIDTDPQQSAVAWRQVRTDDRPGVLSATPATLSRMIDRARDEGATLVVIDTAPHLQPGTSQVVAHADAIFIPTRPTALDLATIPSSVQVARATDKPTAFIVNACPPRAPEVSETIEVLAAYGHPVAPVTIGDRRAFSRAIANGRAVMEFEPRGRAAQEIAELWKWINDKVGETHAA